MKKEILRLLKDYEEAVEALMAYKNKLFHQEMDLKKEEAKINQYSKKEWADLGVSNEAGRKGYKYSALENLYNVVSETKYNINICELNIKFLLKRLDVLCLLYEHEDDCCDCNNHEFIDSHKLLIDEPCP